MEVTSSVPSIFYPACTAMLAMLAAVTELEPVKNRKATLYRHGLIYLDEELIQLTTLFELFS